MTIVNSSVYMKLRVPQKLLFNFFIDQCIVLVIYEDLVGVSKIH